jgi:hypothetical protein
MVVDTRNWLPGKKVLIQPSWRNAVDWTKGKVRVDLLKKSIKNSPKNDPLVPVNREYEERLYDFCGREKN